MPRIIKVAVPRVIQVPRARRPLARWLTPSEMRIINVHVTAADLSAVAASFYDKPRPPL